MMMVAERFGDCARLVEYNYRRETLCSAYCSINCRGLQFFLGVNGPSMHGLDWEEASAQILYRRRVEDSNCLS
jgi:hypothetical protein